MRNVYEGFLTSITLPQVLSFDHAVFPISEYIASRCSSLTARNRESLLLLSRELQAWKQAKKIVLRSAHGFLQNCYETIHKFILISTAVGLIANNTTRAATRLSPCT